MAKDYTKYSFNGQENLTKRGLAEAICKKYYEDNPGITLEAFEKLLPKKRVILEDMVTNENENLYYRERYTLIDGRRVAISNQWGAGSDWENFLSRVKELGYTIN